MSKYKYSIQIDRHYSDIFTLPCVDAIQKISNDTAFAVALRYVKDRNGELRKYAFDTEWLCQDNDGNWHVFTNEEYQLQQ